MRIAPAALLAVVLLAGCGGGTKKSAPPATTTTTAATTTAAAAKTTTAAKTSLPGIASAANCKELADIGQKFSSAVSGTNSADVKKVASLLHEFASKTPSDIRPDFETLANAYSKIADAVGNLKPGSTPDPAALAKLQRLGTQIDATKVAQSSERIGAWLQKNCRA